MRNIGPPGGKIPLTVQPRAPELCVPGLCQLGGEASIARVWRTEPGALFHTSDPFGSDERLQERSTASPAEDDHLDFPLQDVGSIRSVLVGLFISLQIWAVIAVVVFLIFSLVR